MTPLDAGVPEDKIALMLSRWEEDFSVEHILSTRGERPPLPGGVSG